MSNLYEVSLLLLFLLGVLGSMFEKATPRPISLGAGMAVLMMVNTFFALWLHKSGYAGAQELLPALQSTILPWHVLANFIAYACFFVAAVAGGCVLISRDKEVIEAMHVLSGRAIAVGFPMFSLAVLLGCLWAYQAWGGYWSWDPKETWALIVWLTYAGYLHARLTRGWGARALAWWSIVGFAATLFCYIGVNMFLTGLHSYGSL
jgi:ABC-type transport system involved in cytochrome c biogenesis permease subunit